MKVFVSYSSKDKDFATRITTDLKTLGVNIWLDKNRIRASDDWPSKIQEALQTCDIMLLIISPDSMVSPVVKAEMDYFLTKKKPIVPILLRLTEVDFRIHQLQYVDFRTPDYITPFCRLHAELVDQGLDVDPLPATFNRAVRIPQQPPLPLRIEDMISVAKHSLYISGIALDTVTNRHIDKLLIALERNVQIRLLLLDINETLLNETGAWLGYNKGHQRFLRDNKAQVEWFEQHYPGLTTEGMALGVRIRASLLRLSEIDERYYLPPEEGAEPLLQVKMLECRPLFGYLIVDANKKNAQLSASPYFYRLDETRITPPGEYRYPAVFYLSQRSSDEAEAKWFQLYSEDFERLWWWGSRECYPADYR